MCSETGCLVFFSLSVPIKAPKKAAINILAATKRISTFSSSHDTDHSSKKNQSIGYNIQFSLDWFLILIQATLTFEEKRSPRPSNLANRITLAGDSLGDSWHD